MRNLKLLLNFKIHREVFVDSTIIISGQSLQDNDLCSKTKNVFVLSNNILYCVELPDGKVLEYYDLRVLFSGNVPKIREMWYRDLYKTVYICFETGEIYSFLLDDRGVQHSRSCHHLNIDVLKIHWSPDEEFAVVVSTSNLLILINSEFFILAEIDLSDTFLGENELISVGWGKKETQFHGSEGKNAALSKPVIHSPHQDDDHTTNVTWRGDSNLFAVSYWCSHTNIRRVKIFNSEGILQSTSEDIQGLNEPICWKPSGSLITVPQQLPNKKVISFLEKNGLKHGDFTLPSNIKVKEVMWNEASTILCTICENQDNSEEEVMLWTVGNYHWYLKQKFKFTSLSIKVYWDKECPNRMIALCKGGVLQILEWAFVVNDSYYSYCEEKSYVGVIDNDSILLTSFKEAVVPPPMSSYKLKCSDAVNHILFAPVNREECSPYMLCVILYSGDILIFKDPISEPLIMPGLVKQHNFSIEMLSLSHWQWVSADILVFCYSNEFNETLIHQLYISKDEIELSNVFFFNGRIITSNRICEEIIMQTSCGKLFKYNTKSMMVTESLALIEPCYDIKVHPTGLFCLSELSRLYLNNTPLGLSSIIGKVTSFILRDPYLLVTTSSHKLVILQIINSECTQISERKIERGSKLVVTYDNSVVLQAPRGNIETIQPRALTILTLGKLIDSKDYKAALTIMRKQRIDLNLLIDHDQKLFLAEVNNFINQVDSQWITLLLTDLSSEDVTQNMYKAYYGKKNGSSLNGSKVNSVCKALLEAMTNDESRKKYILPMLSALVKLDEMSEAIKLASNEQALQHLMFIVDCNKLYLEALGAYDLDAALKIAEKSPKDPKEYIPYLNSLKALEPNYMKFTIDKKLNRLNSALIHISKCCNQYEEECLNFIEENSLYAPALNLFKDDPKKYSIIILKYGEYLFKQRRYEESGIMFLRGGEMEKAFNSFLRAGNWRQCITTIMDAKLSTEDQRIYLEHVCNMLVSSHKYAEAANLYIEWMDDSEKAIEMYLLGRCWREAIYIAKKFEKNSLIGTLIKESFIEAVNLLIEEIIGHGSNTKKYVERLTTVRIEKENRASYIFDDLSDSASDASSNASTRTSFMSKSSRNTKKMNRKMWSLKEGNPREEEALVATLSQIFSSFEKYVGEVNSSCSLLLIYGEDETAAKLQSVLEDWISVINKSKRIIWPKETEDLNEALILDEKFKHPPEINVPPNWEFHILKF